MHIFDDSDDFGGVLVWVLWYCRDIYDRRMFVTRFLQELKSPFATNRKSGGAFAGYGGVIRFPKTELAPTRWL